VGEHVMAVGIQGGLAKATTGYAYARIQDDSAAIVTSLMECGHPFAVPAVNRPMYRLLDSVMLEVMATRPTCLKPTFEAMFSANPGPRVFRFLDERASPGEVGRLIMTLPKMPFVSGAIRLAASRAYRRVVKRNSASRSHTRSQALDAGAVPPKP
jgi:lycopene beta-cyclase